MNNNKCTITRVELGTFTGEYAIGRLLLEKGAPMVSYSLPVLRSGYDMKRTDNPVTGDAVFTWEKVK